MSRFVLVLIPDSAGKGYTVTVPALPGCVTEGDTLDEAFDNARDAIALYLKDETPESLAAAGVHEDVILAEIDIPVLQAA